ncbi:hypothetical protein Syun_003649 [Stephania yunnanensis]|uniref:Uncharacterized protein n=1 Tax=Stephania yunnanensis TaxID=152371 RepID=A0AAP0L1I1_9MAGN
MDGLKSTYAQCVGLAVAIMTLMDMRWANDDQLSNSIGEVDRDYQRVLLKGEDWLPLELALVLENPEEGQCCHDIAGEGDHNLLTPTLARGDRPPLPLATRGSDGGERGCPPPPPGICESVHIEPRARKDRERISRRFERGINGSDCHFTISHTVPTLSLTPSSTPRLPPLPPTCRRLLSPCQQSTPPQLLLPPSLTPFVPPTSAPLTSPAFYNHAFYYRLRLTSVQQIVFRPLEQRITNDFETNDKRLDIPVIDLGEVINDVKRKAVIDRVRKLS